MIKEVRVGDLLQAEAQTLVNTVNCVGVMGKGIALQFKQRFPEMFADYVQRCKEGRVRLGEPYLFRPLLPPWILNFPTKQDWRSVSKLADIIRGLEYLAAHYKAWGIELLAVPPLGCGSGGLEWRVVGPTLYRYLNRLDIPVYLYAPLETPAEQLSEKFLATGQESDVPDVFTTGAAGDRLQPGWVALVEILSRIEREPFRWPVGRIMFQKLAYFATVAGLPTGLRYERGSYGPFAPGLKTIISKLVNNGLIREHRLGRMFVVKTGITYPDARRAYAAEWEAWDEAMNRVAELLLRMNTRQAEMAATVHFVAQSLPEPTEADVLRETLAWKQKRKPVWRETDVAVTIRNLAALGWINVKPSEALPLPAEEELTF